MSNEQIHKEKLGTVLAVIGLLLIAFASLYMPFEFHRSEGHVTWQPLVFQTSRYAGVGLVVASIVLHFRAKRKS